MMRRCAKAAKDPGVGTGDLLLALNVLVCKVEVGLPLSEPQLSPLKNKKIRLCDSAGASPI